MPFPHVAVVERAVSAHPIDRQQSTVHRSFTYLVTRHQMKVSPSRAAAEFWRDLPNANGRAPLPLALSNVLPCLILTSNDRGTAVWRKA